VIGWLLRRIQPYRRPVTVDDGQQAPRYDLLDTDGRHQHFHCRDVEDLIDQAIGQDPVEPWHLCRRHFASQERLTGAYGLAHCQEGRYVSSVDNDCTEPCDQCRAELTLLDKLRALHPS
jgi:hypothetical protein